MDAPINMVLTMPFLSFFAGEWKNVEVDCGKWRKAVVCGTAWAASLPFFCAFIDLTNFNLYFRTWF